MQTSSEQEPGAATEASESGQVIVPKDADVVIVPVAYFADLCRRAYRAGHEGVLGGGPTIREDPLSPRVVSGGQRSNGPDGTDSDD